MNEVPSASILIIDNDEGVVRAISTRLGASGHRCICAHTGAQGLAEFSQGPIDLVVTDLNMPTLDGMELIRKIRARTHVPIIVITGFRAEYYDGLRGFPDVTVIEKPFDSQAFEDLVATELALVSSSREV